MPHAEIYSSRCPQPATTIHIPPVSAVYVRSIVNGRVAARNHFRIAMIEPHIAMASLLIFVALVVAFVGLIPNG